MPKTCSRCKHFSVKDNRGFCNKYGWFISLELAKQQCLCDFEWHHAMPSGRLVITHYPFDLIKNKREVES